MSFEEKSTWIYAVIVVLVPGVYFANVLGQLQTTPVTEIAYSTPLLTATGVAIALAIVAHIIVAASSPKDADKHDERDTNINRFGEYVGSFVLWPGALVALLMAIGEFEHFWIAHTIYLSFVLSGVVSSVVKILAYRRGFPSW